MSEDLKKFLNWASEHYGDDMIAALDVKEIDVLMALPEFDLADGLSEHEMNFCGTLGKKGYCVDDSTIAGLFQKGCLKWKKTNEIFSVNQSLCGKANKDALVKLYINLKRSGDGSESFR